MKFASPRSEPPFHDEVIVERVARQIVGDIKNFFSMDRLESAAVQNERLRLAHELHDGVLQSLTGIALQLKTVSVLLSTDPQAARAGLAEADVMVASEVRELRACIENLAPVSHGATASAYDLTAALETLCRRAEWQWGLKTELTVGPHESVPGTLVDHIYRIVQEGLTNIGRHARARVARMELQVRPNCVDITVADDGMGFPFRGRYDLAKLTRQNIGPRSLRERVGLLHGGLVLTSSLSGSQLEIRLPLQRYAWPQPMRKPASD